MLMYYRDRAIHVTPEQHQEALKRLCVYKEWLLNKVIKPGVQQTIVVMPLREVKPNYRDEWLRYALYLPFVPSDIADFILSSTQKRVKISGSLFCLHQFSVLLK